MAVMGDRAYRRGAGIQAAQRQVLDCDVPDAPARSVLLTAQRLPAKLDAHDAAELCAAIARKIARSLPNNVREERNARFRGLPRSRTEALLRAGRQMEDVAKDAALRVVERWVGVLRRLVPDEELPGVLSALVHNGPAPSTPTSAERASSSSGRQSPHTSWTNALVPHPTPGPDEPLGEALRRVVPQPNKVMEQRWDFLEELLHALKLEEEFDLSSAMHQLRPSTAEQMEMCKATKIDAAFAKRHEASFLSKKDDFAQHGSIGRRCALSTAAKLRLSGDFSWATYREADRCRVTCCSWSPQVMMNNQHPIDIPGPGQYQVIPPSSATRKTRRAEFPSVGKPRAVGSEVLLAQQERFAAPKGDPWSMYKSE